MDKSIKNEYEWKMNLEENAKARCLILDAFDLNAKVVQI